MLRSVRVWLVTYLAAAFITIPWSGACANERGMVTTPQQSASSGGGRVWRSAVALVPSESRLMRQSVASTNESKLLVGVIAGAAVVTGVTMLAYGATSSCKGKQGNTTATCDRIATLGAAGLAGGAITLVLWKLTK